jgi:hypothetical protein
MLDEQEGYFARLQLACSVEADRAKVSQGWAGSEVGSLPQL